MGSQRVVSVEELARHASPSDCWVSLRGIVYDVTPYLDAHPGGRAVILECAGGDGGPVFEALHPPGLVDNLLKPEWRVGRLEAVGGDPGEAEPQQAQQRAPASLSDVLNVYDMQVLAKERMTPSGWAYYVSGAEDEVTLRENEVAFTRIWLRPRVLVNVLGVNGKGPDTKRCIVPGVMSRMPVYVTATALGALAHPEGEVAIARAAHAFGVPYMMPTLASFSLEQMCAGMDAVDAAHPDGSTAASPRQHMFQLYVNADRAMTLQLIRRAEAAGVTALVVTVDAPQLGRRERDMRHRFAHGAPNIQAERGTGLRRNEGTSKAISGFIDATLSWDDMHWLRAVTHLPLIIKGIQCGEDAVRAAQLGFVYAVVVSNHGGRQLDYGRSAIEALPEVVAALRAHARDACPCEAPNQAQPQPQRNCQPNGGGRSCSRSQQPNTMVPQVWIDGGIRRGTDVFKALALGASAVGIGRPVLYGLAAFGADGVSHVLRLLLDELHTTMMMMGTPSVDTIGAKYVDARALDQHVSAHATPRQRPAIQYEPLQGPLRGSKL